MPQDRPRIPAETQKLLLIEAGHRCCACGAELPLERAHIVSWSRSRDHSLANLICLCANCHARADNEKWGEEVLRHYKEQPWVLRSRLLHSGDHAAVASALHQLPSPPGDFIGRASELEALRAAAEVEGVGLLGLWGMGGVGKTALALKLAERLVASYPDAQIYFDLKGVSAHPLQPAEAMTYVIHSFRPEVSLPESDDRIAALYRSVLHGCRALLVFENAGDALQVGPLLPPAGSLLLFTSRTRFHLPGLRAINVVELPSDGSQKLLLQIEPRIGSMADPIARICAGLPFALRHAAATLSVRPDLAPAAYAAQLAEVTGRCGLIEGSLSLSIALLSESTAARWRALAVFPSAFDLAAASEVWAVSGNAAEILLADLITRSLLQGSDGRYWLHDLARALAGSRLSNDEKSEAERRHSRHYLLVAGRCAKAFMHAAEIDALRTLDIDWANIKEGFANAVRASASDPAAARFAVGYPVVCQPFLPLRFHPSEALRWLDATLPLAREQGDSLFTVTLLNSMGVILRRTGRHGDARERLQEALALAAPLSNGQLEGTILGNLGNELVFLGDLEQARTVLDRALALARESGDHHGEVVALGGLERLYSELGDHAGALEIGRNWLAAARQLSRRHSEGQALGNMGVSYMHLNDPAKAIECFRADLAIARELGDLQGQAASLGNLGWALAILGEPESAARLLEMRIELSRRVGDIRGEAESSWALGNIYEEMGEFARAAELKQVFAEYRQRIFHPRAADTIAEVTALRVRLRQAAAVATSDEALL